MKEGRSLKELKTLTRKLDMELIFWFEYLDVKRAVWSEILHCPGSQDGLMVLTGSRHIKHFFPSILKFFK